MSLEQVKETGPTTVNFWHEQKDLMLVSLTVLFFYLSFPGADLPYFAWIAIVPALLAMQSAKPRHAFFIGLLAALFGWMVSIWWSVEGVAKISQSHPSTILPIIFCFCIYSALPYALSSWLYCRFQWQRSILGALKFATVLTLLVNYTPQLLPGNLAHSLYIQPSLIQLAAIGGVPLVFFVIHIVNALFAHALYLQKYKIRGAMHAVLLAVAICVANGWYGHVQLQKSPIETSSKQTLNVAIVQPNIGIDERSREDWPAAQEKINQLIEQAKAQHIPIDLIVLPEVPVPISYQNYSSDRLSMNNWSEIADVLSTSISFDGQSSSLEKATQYYNSVEHISHQRLQTSYHKQRLVPFAEYLPFEQELPWLRDIFPNTPNYNPGTNSPYIEIDNQQISTSVVPLICYEAVFSGLVGQGVAAGGSVLLNVVNDAWFADLAGKKVHLALSLFRAVEYQRPLVRVTNNGISGLINHKGVFDPNSMLKLHDANVKIVRVTPITENTIYQRYPRLFLLVAVLFLVLTIFTPYLRTTFKRKSQHEPM
ncbi:apolipoprotein N-acyltransferase [uncultured Paraglaciecola sp.]|uniref:apolipoprotein N-acyltransferase n=1 Tax=uncultured Paraglaciecola sp. TaxID=1765024 RepID=UPI0030D9B264|tara:strand:+ start:16549 stop:18162 length:1614 start_codon:yes stop_codon:yes gene_type:complete